MLLPGNSALDISVRVQPLPGEPCADLTWRILEKLGDCQELAPYQEDGEKGGYRIPLDRIGPGLRGRILRSIFPKDRIEGDCWHHRVTYTNQGGRAGETLWSLAELFCGAGQKHKELRRAASLSSDRLELDQEFAIPASLLIPGLIQDTAHSETVVGELTFRRDDQGEYASYRLKRKEALYSAVVIRFTDLVTASEVLKASEEVMRRSGIRDPRNIPAGYEIKIPKTMVSTQYLPPSDPLRRSYEARMREVRTYQRGERARGLEGVHVILDPGHGGEDPGTIGCCGVVEDEAVYDVACRLRHLLQTETRAAVDLTLEDPRQGYRSTSTLGSSTDKGERILTHPPFSRGDHRAAVHLRWYLSNSLYRKARGRKISSDRVVFLSLHADALHPSTSGVMVYVPGASLRTGSFGKRGREYDARSEVREKRTVRFSRKERYRSEGLARQLAAQVVKAFRRQGLPVHANRPIRGSIVREGRKRWVPAVLRYNQVPTSVLVELANLQNRGDCSAMKKEQTRETMARALMESLLAYYEE